MTAPGYYDESLTPEILGLVTANPATGATAGIPGSWTPAGATPPATLAALQGGSPVTVVASPVTGWTTGQYVQTRTAGAAGRATWTGTGWVGGAAPLAASEVAAMTIDDVKAFIEEHPDLLSEVHAFEQAGRARSGLLTWLKQLLDEEAAANQ
jgi:hypothetical protein